MEKIHIRRSIAFVIDISLPGSVAAFVENFFPLSFKIGSFNLLNAQFTLYFTLIVVVYYLYLLLFDIVKNGDTIGKLLLNITTVSKNGERLTLKKCIIRSLYKTLSIMLLPVSVFLFVFKNQYTIQDHYCHTVTIRRT